MCWADVPGRCGKAFRDPAPPYPDGRRDTSELPLDLTGNSDAGDRGDPGLTFLRLSADDPARVAAKAVVVEEVERLHWRIWNGQARDAQVSIDRIHAVMHHFRGEPDQRRSTAPSRKLWTASRALDGDLTGQRAWLLNDAERHRAGLRVGTAITEGTANVLVNRRMNITADELVATRRRSAAAGSLRRL